MPFTFAYLTILIFFALFAVYDKVAASFQYVIVCSAGRIPELIVFA